MTDKPVVRYSALIYCEVGKPALVKPINHPSASVFNTKDALTSNVISYDKNTGAFETRNTRYEADVRG